MIGASLAYPDGWCALPAAPHRTRTAVRAVERAPGQAHWPPPQARCHHGPLANGPGRNPPYCVRSGGANTVTWGAPIPLRSGTSPASLAGPCGPGLGPSAVFVLASPLYFPGFPPSRAPFCAPWFLPCPVCPNFLSPLWRFVYIDRAGLWLPGVPTAYHPSLPLALWSVLRPPPCPLAVSSLSSSLSLVTGGYDGGRPCCLPSGVCTLRARCRHEGRHLSLCGGGLAVWPPSLPLVPCVPTPGVPSVGGIHSPSTLRARPCGSAPSHCCLPSLPLCPRGAHIPSPHYRLPLPMGVGVCVAGGGRPCCLSSVARTLRARCKHEARHLVAVGGGVFLFWPPRPLPFLSVLLCGAGGLAVRLSSAPFVPSVPVR